MQNETGGYILIYPLLNYKDEFWLKENFDQEDKQFKAEIDQKKKDALEQVDNDKKKLDFDQKRDCYIDNVQDFVFDMDTIQRDQKGDVVGNTPKSAEYLAEMEYKNQVYERLFRKLEEQKKKKNDDSSSDEFSDDDESNPIDKDDLRGNFI